MFDMNVVYVDTRFSRHCIDGGVSSDLRFIHPFLSMSLHWLLNPLMPLIKVGTSRDRQDGGRARVGGWRNGTAAVRRGDLG